MIRVALSPNLDLVLKICPLGSILPSRGGDTQIHGHGDDDFGSRSGSRFGIEATVNQVYSFLHAYKSQAAIPLNFFEVETGTRVLHNKLNIVPCAAHLHRELPSPTVLYSVVQCLLSDAEKAKRDICGQVCWHAFLLELNAYLVLFANLMAQAFDRNHSSHVIEFR